MLLAGLLLAACTPQTAENNPQRPDNSQPEQPGNHSGDNTEQPGDKPEDTTPDFTPEAWYQTNYWDRTDREKQGLRGKVKTLHVTSYSDQPTYTFDEAGHLLSYSFWTFTYDAQGRKTRAVYQEPDGPASTIDYVYENGDKLVSVYDYLDPQWYDVSRTGGSEAIWFRDVFIRGLSQMKEADWNPMYTSIKEHYYTFGADGNLTIKERSYSMYTHDYEAQTENPELFNEQEFTMEVVYQNGLPSSSRDGSMNISWQANGMPARFDSITSDSAYSEMHGATVQEATWLQNDRVMSIDHFKVPSGYAGSWSPIVLWESQFNEHGDIIQWNHLHGTTYELATTDAPMEDYYTDYVYDAHGNWTSRNVSFVAIFTGDRGTHHEERELTYY